MRCGKQVGLAGLVIEQHGNSPCQLSYVIPEKKITLRSRAIVAIHPNNSTGAVYATELLDGTTAQARRADLMQFADEIYARIVYDDAVHHPLAALSEDVPTVTFNSLSKAYRAAGFRTGWMVASGPKERARDYSALQGRRNVRHMCEAGVSSLPRPSGGCRKCRPMTSSN